MAATAGRSHDTSTSQMPVSVATLRSGAGALRLPKSCPYAGNTAATAAHNERSWSNCVVGATLGSRFRRHATATNRDNCDVGYEFAIMNEHDIRHGAGCGVASFTDYRIINDPLPSS